MSHVLYEPPSGEIKNLYRVTVVTHVMAASENEAEWEVADRLRPWMEIWDTQVMPAEVDPDKGSSQRRLLERAYNLLKRWYTLDAHPRDASEELDIDTLKLVADLSERLASMV
jgi:hypothetical protein